VNIVRDIGEIFEFPADVNNVPIYHDANIINGVDNIIFEKKNFDFY
jgi:hypothetical protein